MVANAITFEQPVLKLYMVLPKCTSLLVRRKKILKALELLKLNHVNYADLGVSYKNLQKMCLLL